MPYKVEFYYQAEGAYPEVATLSEDREGTMDTSVAASDEDKTPTKEGYVFDEAAGNVLEGTVDAEGNPTLKVFFKQQFSVTYKDGLDGAAFDDQVSGNLDYGVETPAFEGAPERAGYTFAGWDPEVADTVSADATYTATWEPRADTPYTVETYYQVDGAYPAQADTSETREGTTDTAAAVTDEDKTPAKEKYALDDAAENVFEGTVAGDGSLVLKVFFKQQFSVSYADGLDGKLFETETHSGLDLGAVTPAFEGSTERAGYNFMGWVKNSDPDAEPGEVDATVTRDETYIAAWEPRTDIPYTVEFYYQAEGAYPETATSSDAREGLLEAIATATDEDKTPTKEGYIFDEAAENVLEGTIALDGSLVLKLYFKQQFSVSYADGLDGKLFPTQTTSELDYGVETPTFEGTPARPGYNFIGWLKNSDPDATPGDVDATVTANETYIAAWEAMAPVEYTITYHLEGGTLNGSEGPVSVSYEVGTVITLPEPSREGYTFMYWRGSTYKAGDAYTVTENHSFTAVWQANAKPQPKPTPTPTPTPKPAPKPIIPKTGDEANLGLMAGILGVGVVLAGVSVALKMRGNKK